MLKSLATKAITTRKAPLNNPSAFFHTSHRALDTGTPNRLIKSQQVFRQSFGENNCGGMKVKKLTEDTLLVSDEDLLQKSQDPVFVRTTDSVWTNNGSLQDFIGNITNPKKHYFRLESQGLYAQSCVTIREGQNKGFGDVIAVDATKLKAIK